MILTHLALLEFLSGVGTDVTVPPGISIITTSDLSSYDSGAFTPTAGDLLVVMFRAGGVPPADPIVTSSAGLTFVLAAKSSTNTFIYIAEQLAAAVSQFITINFGAAGVTALGGSVERVAGMNRVGLDAMRQTDDDSGGTGTTPQVDLPAPAIPTNPILLMVGNGSNPAALTPPPGWTETFDLGIGTPTLGYESAVRSGGFSGTAIDWAAVSASAWRAIGIELDASIPAGSPATGDGAGLLVLRRRRM